MLKIITQNKKASKTMKLRIDYDGETYDLGIDGDIDEKGASGAWDYAGEIANNLIMNGLCHRDDYDTVQDRLYNILKYETIEERA
jgi:hypothetical protein